MFLLRILRCSSCEAHAHRGTAVIDISAVLRSNLLNAAICGLTTSGRTVRVAAYAALESFTEALGPSVGKPGNSGAGLFKERRQLAFVLESLRFSISGELPQLLPFFAASLCGLLPVVLQPTHKAFREVTRLLLRSPAQDPHDAEFVSFLLRDSNRACRELGLEIMEKGIRTMGDHHVARKRRLYDVVLSYGDLRASVERVLTAIVHSSNGQIAGDLVRSHGILSWLTADLASSASEHSVGGRLRLLGQLACSLPEGVLRERYAPCFQVAVEKLSEFAAGSEVDLRSAVRAVCSVEPHSRRLLNVARMPSLSHCLVYQVYRKQSGTAPLSLVLEAIKACYSGDPNCDDFPSVPAEVTATEAFIADCLLRDPKLCVPCLRDALAHLLLSRQCVSSWMALAAVHLLGGENTTPAVNELASRIPGQLTAGALCDDMTDGNTLPARNEFRKQLAGLLFSRP
jgi:hypothetical protein